MRVSWKDLVVYSVCFAAITLPIIPIAAQGAETDARAPERSDAGMGQWLKRLGKVRLPGEYERSHAAVTGAFRELTAASEYATTRVLCDGMQTAIGTVVRSDGMILTKASELSGKLECILSGGARLPAEVVAKRDNCDLALLHVATANLPEIRWSEASTLPIGSWVVTTGLQPQPIAIGVVSAPLQSSPMPQAVLGVSMYRVDNGVRINLVMPGTGAERAGMRAGDVIATINGREADSPDTISNIVRSLLPGDKVTLKVVREQAPLSLTATLGDMSRIGGLEQAELMDSLGGPLSKRRAGFPSVIQHDSIVQPRECGSPIVDLNGQVVGINIARVSRVATYALPATIAREAVRDMLREAARLAPLQQQNNTVTTAQSTSAGQQ